jgi:hypothetical protein
MAGCTKNKNNNINSQTNVNDTTLGVEAYVYTYNQLSLASVGDSVPFYGYLMSVIPSIGYYAPYRANYTCSWNFGDGGTCIDTSTFMDIYGNFNWPGYSTKPYHVYTTPGTYTINMKIHEMSNNDSFTASSFSVNVCADPLYTHQICQPRLWHGGKEIVTPVNGTSTTYNLPDTTFAISFFDKVDIYFAPQLFVYSPHLSTGNRLIFNGLNNSMVYFNSLTDSIYMVIYSSWEGPDSPPTAYEISYHSP